MRTTIIKQVRQSLGTHGGDIITVVKAPEKREFHCLTRRKIQENELILTTTKIDEFVIRRETFTQIIDSDPYQKIYLPERLKAKKIPLVHTPPQKGEALVLEIQIER